jgi:3-hydroxyisobutyrate dehydrogenase-like beta-hydroxyacid dehydrogenase
MNIAFLGLGGMGGAMARNLIKHVPRRFRWSRGDLRTFRMERRGWFRTPVPRNHLVSAEIAITMLANDDAVDSVTLGANGLAEGLAKGAVHVSMSTISVALSEHHGS